MDTGNLKCRMSTSLRACRPESRTEDQVGENRWSQTVADKALGKQLGAPETLAALTRILEPAHALARLYGHGMLRGRA